MDCRRCKHVRYDGCRHGRCSHSGHLGVVLSPGKDGKRPYNRQICPDFEIRARCSNCIHWIRGEYFSDGMTPARKGRCDVGNDVSGGICPGWKISTKTSWRKRKKGEKR